MVKFAIIIVGRGKLANELLTGLESSSISRVLRWEERDSLQGDKCMVVHAGSGRELCDVVTFCSETGSTLLDLSTGESKYSEIINYPIVLCPNVNMQMLYFMAMIKQASKYFEGQDISILESHQASKSTKPGTAVYIAKSLGIPENQIKSERDPKIQAEEIGIPSQFLDRHAFHQIKIKSSDVEIRLETRVLGKSAYASGLSKIIDLIAKRELKPGYFDIVDLIDGSE